jgi:hypothetical protein
MHATTFFFALSSLVAYTIASAGSCHGQRLYCGQSLKNMGQFSCTNVEYTSYENTLTFSRSPGWSNDDIWAGLSKGEQWYPSELDANRLPQTLFECDGRSGDDALWWRSACADGGCHDAGYGHSDYCE